MPKKEEEVNSKAIDVVLSISSGSFVLHSSSANSRSKHCILVTTLETRIVHDTHYWANIARSRTWKTIGSFELGRFWLSEVERVTVDDFFTLGGSADDQTRIIRISSTQIDSKEPMKKIKDKHLPYRNSSLVGRFKRIATATNLGVMKSKVKARMEDYN